MNGRSIADLITIYLEGDGDWHGARVEYPPKPGATSTHTEADNMAYALRDLAGTVIELDDPGDERATRRGPVAASRHLADLTPDQLRPGDMRAIQRHMIERGLCRSEVNSRKNRILRWCRWCVEYEHADESMVTRLGTVKPVRKGQHGVRDKAKVTGVDMADIDAVLKVARPTLARAIRVQLLTGMRPGELLKMRFCDLKPSRGGDLWEYRPSHKTEHLGRVRLIPIGPEAQLELRDQVHSLTAQGNLVDGEIITPRLGDAHDTRAFWPWKRTGAYGDAIKRACARAGVAPWSPNQLRHTRGTLACRARGEDVAAELLGHADPSMTRRHYIDPDHDGARQYAMDFG